VFCLKPFVHDQSRDREGAAGATGSLLPVPVAEDSESMGQTSCPCHPIWNELRLLIHAPNALASAQRTPCSPCVQSSTMEISQLGNIVVEASLHIIQVQLTVQLPLSRAVIAELAGVDSVT